MATFTWTATTGGGTTAWETAAAWWDSTGSTHPSSFTLTPGADYIVGSSNFFTINQIGAGGTSAPDIANSLTLTDVQATMLFADHGALRVATTLSLNGIINLGTAAGGGVLEMGVSGAAGGTILINKSGRLAGGQGDTVVNLGTSASTIIGTGTILAQTGLFEIMQGVQIGAGTSLTVSINAGARVKFDDAVASGTVKFGTSLAAIGELDIVDLPTFKASVTQLAIGTGANNIAASSFIDLMNVGTNATATMILTGTTAATINVLTAGQTQTITLAGNYTGKHVNFLSDGGGGTNVFLTDTPCYAAGTAIMTPDGEVAVEAIEPGDVVMTAGKGRLIPQTVKWTGLREIVLTGHPRPASVAPIRFRSGSLGPDLPRRDLLVSPDHCLFLDGGLIPAKLLLNGMTIARDTRRDAVVYHHIELDRHGLLIAEGVEAESYLDTGNRAYFGNAGVTAILHPEFGVNAHLRSWATDACAPLLTRPEDVRPVWDRLVQRALDLGFTPPGPATTREAEIGLIVGVRRFRPLSVMGQTVSFAISGAAGSPRLVSRSIVPSRLKPWLDDPRRLGVAIRSIALRDRSGETVLPADHPALTDGWHAAETGPDGAVWRWTTGDAVLPLVTDGPCVIEIELSETTLYLQTPHLQTLADPVWNGAAAERAVPRPLAA